MKPSTYPPFIAIGLVSVQLADNKSAYPDIKVKASTYINHWDDVHRGLTSNVKHKLYLLGVPNETLASAYFETEDVEYIALEPRGVRRVHGEPVTAFYHHEPKKRALLIRQRRLVPDGPAEMVEMYGKVQAVKTGGAA